MKVWMIDQVIRALRLLTQYQARRHYRGITDTQESL